MIRGALPLLALLAGCGVAGRPLPPGPIPPAAPTIETIRRTPEGIEVMASPPRADIDGAPLAEPPEILAYVDAPACRGVPTARGPANAPLRVPLRPEGAAELRLVAALGVRQGPPSPPAAVTWAPPPPPPDAPLAYVDTAGIVQLSWLPPAAQFVRVLRDDHPIAEVPADAAVHSDPAPPGRHHYTLEAIGADFRTAPSAPAEVVVPR